MSPIFFVVTLVLIAGQFSVPQRLAFAPLIVAASLFPDLVVIDVGVAFTLTKLLILFGLIRAACSGMLTWSSRNSLDVLFAAWACWTLLSALGHEPTDHNPFTVRASMAYDVFGAYLYARAYIPDRDSVLRLSRLLALCMIFLASMVTFEKTTTLNIPWTISTGSSAYAESRDGRIRAGGPFRHPILAGTVGATSVALLLPLWRRNRGLVAAGISACLAIVFCSASSGPVMTLFFAVAAVALWPWRRRMRLIKAALILTFVLLAFTMKAPIWYLIGRIDIVGGSTGWHRAELITQAFKHLDRWWLFGTDYTRDWMAYGIGWSANMVDITNHYLQMGVKGGLLLMLLFIAILVTSFKSLGYRMADLRSARDPGEFMLWCFGAALFAHCMTFLSVSYFDQSNVFLYFTIGVVPALCLSSIQLSDSGSAEIEGETIGDGQDLANVLPRDLPTCSF